MKSNKSDQKIKTFGTYSAIKRAGNYWFISGHLGIDYETNLVMEGIKAQTIQTIKNIEKSLKMAGLKLKDVVKTTVFLTDSKDFIVMNQIYGEYFKDTLPSRSTVIVKALPSVGQGTLPCIEIEAVAMKGSSDDEKI